MGTKSFRFVQIGVAFAQTANLSRTNRMRKKETTKIALIKNHSDSFRIKRNDHKHLSERKGETVEINRFHHINRNSHFFSVATAAYLSGWTTWKRPASVDNCIYWYDKYRIAFGSSSRENKNNNDNIKSKRRARARMNRKDTTNSGLIETMASDYNLFAILMHFLWFELHYESAFCSMCVRALVPMLKYVFASGVCVLVK